MAPTVNVNEHTTYTNLLHILHNYLIRRARQYARRRILSVSRHIVISAETRFRCGRHQSELDVDQVQGLHGDCLQCVVAVVDIVPLTTSNVHPSELSVRSRQTDRL